MTRDNGGLVFGTLAAVLVTASLLAGCERTVKVTVCRPGTVVVSDLSARADVVDRPELGTVYTAEKPPKMPPPGWWVTTAQGKKGFMDGRSGALFPVEGQSYTVDALYVDVLEAPEANAKQVAAHNRGAVIKAAALPGCTVPDDWLAVLDAGRVVGFVTREKLTAK